MSVSCISFLLLPETLVKQNGMLGFQREFSTGRLHNVNENNYQHMHINRKQLSNVIAHLDLRETFKYSKIVTRMLVVPFLK